MSRRQPSRARPAKRRKDPIGVTVLARPSSTACLTPSQTSSGCAFSRLETSASFGSVAGSGTPVRRRRSPPLGWPTGLWSSLPAPGQAAQEEPKAERQVALCTPGACDMSECMCRGGPTTQDAAAGACGLSQGFAFRSLRLLVEVGLVRVLPSASFAVCAAVPEAMARRAGSAPPSRSRKLRRRLSGGSVRPALRAR